uniref:C-type lectin domain-containing protein n=1 Tax=Oryzias latipes TaxID=8090 RepID=A0A3B3H3M7_ORYLA
TEMLRCSPFICIFNAKNQNLDKESLEQPDFIKEKRFRKNYVFINQTMSWSSAQQYCRENYKDLAMIENQEENTEAQNTKPSNYKVWIGLYQEPWTWSDGSKSSFRNWYPSGLNNYGGNQHCGTENSEHVWGDEDCRVKRVFVCHQDWPIGHRLKHTSLQMHIMFFKG